MEKRYYHTTDSVAEYIQMSKGVNGKTLIEQLNERIKPNSKVLELGSGPGSDWHILSKTHQVTGSDYSEEFLKYLTLKYPTGEFLLLNAVTMVLKDQYDAIYSNKVLQHLSDEELVQSIKKQSQYLNSDGVICHSFWYGKGSEKFKGTFVNYQNMDSIKALFSNAFDVVTLSKYTEFEKDDSILLIAIKK